MYRIQSKRFLPGLNIKSMTFADATNNDIASHRQYGIVIGGRGNDLNTGQLLKLKIRTIEPQR